MEQPDLKALFQMINELQQYASQLGLQLSPEAKRPEPPKVSIPPELSRINDFLRTGDPACFDNTAYIDTYVGLSVGEHEEVADASYRRQQCRFVFNPELDRWVNDHDVHFPPAVAPYGCDAIIIEGRDVYKKLVARMGSPVMLGTGNACGYLKGSLGVTPDQMRKATWRDVPTAAPVQHAEPPKAVPLSEMFAGHMAGHNAASDRALRDLDTLVQQLVAPTEEPPVNKPAYCDRCERMPVTKYNHLVAMGYSVSHLVELPAEAGYAVPCQTCRTR